MDVVTDVVMGVVTGTPTGVCGRSIDILCALELPRELPFELQLPLELASRDPLMASSEFSARGRELAFDSAFEWAFDSTFDLSLIHI